MEGPSRFPNDIFDVSFVEWDNEETELVAGTDKGVAKDKEQTSVPRSLSSGRPPFATAVLPHEVTGSTAAVGASFLGADLFNLGEQRVPGVAWVWRLARVLGDAMVVVFFGWLVTKLGG
jgi:hypothetical protein